MSARPPDRPIRPQRGVLANRCKTRRDLAAQFNVSRESLARLEAFAALLIRWQSRINLIAPSTIDDLWWRHIADSLQLLCLIPDGARRLIDLGSGGGFPGVVLALCRDSHQLSQICLIEAHQKKAAFLREALRPLGGGVEIYAGRITAAELEKRADSETVLTARGLAPLPDLLDLTAPALKKGAVGLFHKGQDVDNELTQTTKYPNIALEKTPSKTHPDSVILRVGEFNDVG